MKVAVKGRLSFPDLFKPGKSFNEGEEGTYAASILFEEGDENHKAIEKAIEDCVAESFPKDPDEAKRVLAGCRKNARTFLKDGSDKKWEGYGEGTMYITARSKKRPVLYTAAKEQILEDGPDNPIYAGCKVKAVIDVWFLDAPKIGKRVCARLLGVQFIGHGEPFVTGGKVSDDDFGVEEVDE